MIKFPDVSEIPIVPAIAITIAVVSAVVFVKLSKKERPELNRLLNLAFFVHLVAGMFAGAWILAQVVLGKSPPPLQLLAFVVFATMYKQSMIMVWEPLLETQGVWANVFLSPAVELSLLAMYFATQSTSFFASMEYVGPLFATIRVPNENVVSVFVLAYLFVEYLISAGGSLVTYANSGDPDYVRALCNGSSSSTKAGLTHACVNALRRDKSVYSLFMQILALLLHSAYHYYALFT